jgi:hypothetical protein
MGILERHWLITHFGELLAEMEYHREHSKSLKFERIPLWKLDNKEGRAKIETSK